MFQNPVGDPGRISKVRRRVKGILVDIGLDSCRELLEALGAVQPGDQHLARSSWGDVAVWERSRSRVRYRNKPYCCSLCSYSSKMLAALNNHVHRSHKDQATRELLAACPHCRFASLPAVVDAHVGMFHAHARQAPEDRAAGRACAERPTGPEKPLPASPDVHPEDTSAHAGRGEVARGRVPPGPAPFRLALPQHRPRVPPAPEASRSLLHPQPHVTLLSSPLCRGHLTLHPPAPLPVYFSRGVALGEPVNAPVLTLSYPLGSVSKPHAASVVLRGRGPPPWDLPALPSHGAPEDACGLLHPACGSLRPPGYAGCLSRGASCGPIGTFVGTCEPYDFS